MIKKLLSSQLRINMASGVVVTVINALAMMAAFPIYLHFLGYEKYGVWLVLATVLTFAQLGNLGIGQAIMKLVAEEHGRDDIKGIQQYVTTALALLCLSGTVVLVVILLLKNQIIAPFKLSDENAKMALWLLPYIGILSIYVFIVQALNATLSGLGRMDLANYTQSLGRIVALCVTTTLLYSGRGIESLLIGSTVSYVFIHVASLICIWRIAHIRILRIDNLDAQRCKRLLHFGGTVFGGSVIRMFLSPFNKLMLSRYAGVSAIPVYDIAYRGTKQFQLLGLITLKSLMPEISRLNSSNSMRDKTRMLSIDAKAMKLVCIYAVPLLFIALFFSPQMLCFWLGDSYTKSLNMPFRVFFIGTTFTLFGAPAANFLVGTGRVDVTFQGFTLHAVSNVFLVLFCLLYFAPITVSKIACATAFAMTINTLYIMSRKRILTKAFRSAQNISTI